MYIIERWVSKPDVWPNEGAGYYEIYTYVEKYSDAREFEIKKPYYRVTKVYEYSERNLDG